MGKKNKKPKGKVLSLSEFLGTDVSAGNAVIMTKQSSWADEDDVDDDRGPPERIVLPTAPRQARGANIDMDRVPTSPPFIAYVANLPFEVEDIDIERHFHNIPIMSIRLPRDGGENGRFKGFGYVEFNSKADLLEALSKNEEMMRNRKIRVDVAEEEGQGGRRDRSNFSREEREDRSGGISDWRAAKEPSAFDTERRDNYGSKYGRDKDEFDRGSRFGGSRYDDRSRGGGRYEDRNSSFGRDKWRPPGGAGRDDRSEPKERLKLQLKPRSVAVETTTGETPQAASSIFGSAKPVDTAAREQQIADKLTKKTPEANAKREVRVKDIFGDAKPVDTALREKEIEDRLRKQMRPNEDRYRDNLRGSSKVYRKKDYDEKSQDSYSRSNSRSPHRNNNDDNASLHEDDNRNYDSEYEDNEKIRNTPLSPEDNNKDRGDIQDRNKNTRSELPKSSTQRQSEGDNIKDDSVTSDRKYSPKILDRSDSPRTSDRSYSPKNNYKQEQKDLSPKRNCGNNSREYSPKRDDRREYSPRRDDRREHSPRRDDRRENSPRRDDRRENSPRRDDRREHSPRRGDRRENSPRRDDRRENSPRRDDRRENSPRRVDRREISPRRVDRREISPRRNYREDRREYSPRRADRDYSGRRDNYRREYSPKRSNRGYSPRRNEGRDYSPRRDGRRDFSPKQSFRDDRPDYSFRKSGYGNRNDYSRDSGYRKFSPRRNDQDRHSSPRRYGRDDNKGFSSYRRKDDEYANFSSRKPNRDNYGKGYSRDYGKSNDFDRYQSRNDDYDRGSYRRPAPPKQYSRNDHHEDSSPPPSQNRRTGETNRNELHNKMSKTDSPTPDCPPKVDLPTEVNRDQEEKILKRGKKKRDENIVIGTANKFAQLGLEEEDV